MLSALIFFVFPIASVWAFIIYYARYSEAKNKNRENPGTFSDEELKNRKLKASIFGIIAAFFVVILIGLLVLMFGAIAFM